MVSGREIQVPVRNQTEQDLEIRVNEVIARRVAIVPAPQVEPEQLNRLLTYDDIEKPESLNSERQVELLDILNKHRTCFATSMDELGCTNIGTMDITLKPGSVPYAAKPYRVSRDEREEIRRHIQTWREHGIVEDTTSPHAAPVLLVRKKKVNPG